MTNCSNEYPLTEVFYAEISHDTTAIVLLGTSCLLSLLCLLIYLEQVVFLIRHHHDDIAFRINSKLVILALFPVISLLSLITILVPRSTVLVDLLISCYLSVCIYTFVALTIDYFGGDVAMVREFKDEKIRLNLPPCCCCCCCILKPIALTRTSLRRFKLCSLQVVFVRPLLLFIGAVLWTDEKYEETFDLTNGYTYISFFNLISTLFSIYGMIVIFRASIVKLQQNALKLKFVPVQLCILLVNLQDFIFSAMAQRDIPACFGQRGPRVRVAAISHFVLIIEMLLLSILARLGYRRIEEKGQDDRNTAINENPSNGIENLTTDCCGSISDL